MRDIEAWFELFGEPDDCQDNERVALVGNAAEEADYARARDGGCCGFVDEVLESGNAKYLVGFNHGH